MSESLICGVCFRKARSLLWVEIRRVERLACSSCLARGGPPDLPKKNKRQKRRKRRPKKRQPIPSKHKKVIAAERRLNRIASAPGRGVSKLDREWVLELYGDRCLACGCGPVLPYMLDHVEPLFKGGRHDPDNLQPLCWGCNRTKGIRTVDHRPTPYRDWESADDWA